MLVFCKKLNKLSKEPGNEAEKTLRILIKHLPADKDNQIFRTGGSVEVIRTLQREFINRDAKAQVNLTPQHLNIIKESKGVH